jgi:heptosyltransferase-2
MKQKILFICEGQLGDLLILTPALRGMKKSFPDSELSVMIVQRRSYFDNVSPDLNVVNTNAEKGTSLVLLNNPFVDKVFEVNRPNYKKGRRLARIKAEWKTLKYLRQAKYDIVICTFPEDRFVLWAYLSGAKIRVGQRNQALSWLLTNKPDIEKEKGGVLNYYCDLASDAGAQFNSLDTEYYINEESEKWANELLLKKSIDGSKKMICIHPGASGDYKIWPPERFAEVYDKLQSLDNTNVFLIGAKYDEPILSEIKKHIKTKLVYIDSSGSIDRFAAILKISDLCLSNDSGPRHLAIAVGTPTISIMSRKSHIAWKIYNGDKNIVLQGKQPCEKCSENDCREIITVKETFGAECIRTIGVDEVMQQVKAILLI